ncbi:hypothetical protein SAMN04488074_13640 [Lentzea albidocapillata subsp. violacea]|uniref:Uncharacterized protein n=1 Tax=Lentzea albidocapillata subsp. violacea TaxID=128104 RepID=A0A1G9YZ58_9PSEU|nr:hypothetical protein [Lentzea albidocapillata]SDN14432.1 hypothetical protein SAMN04488074_13640 [Lentzea albidocapillata subsp. violacea]
MPYPTTTRPASERAAATVLGAVTGLILGGQDDAARHVVDGLDTGLLRDVHGLANERTDAVLVGWLRLRLDKASAAAESHAVPAGPDPVYNPDADGPVLLEEKVKRALRLKLPADVLKAVTKSGAYGVLVYRVGQAMDADDKLTPLDVLKELGEAKFALVGGMTDPASYLASHVKTCWDLP